MHLNRTGSFERFANAPGASSQRGVTLIEAVLFIVISLGLIVGGIIFFQQANLASRVNDTLRVVTGIQSETRALFSSQAGFGGDETDADDLNPLLIQSGAVPSSILGGGENELTNAWGGDITVEGQGNEFTVTLTDLPTAACARVASVEENGTGPAGVGITEVTVGEESTDPASGDADPSSIAGDCDDQADDGQVDVTWTFTR